MTKYDIVAVLWQDHMSFQQALLPNDPDKVVERPTLSVGFLFKETETTLTVVHQIEPYDDYDESNYTIIFKGTVVGVHRYGKIKLRKLRGEGKT